MCIYAHVYICTPIECRCMKEKTIIIKPRYVYVRVTYILQFLNAYHFKKLKHLKF